MVESKNRRIGDQMKPAKGKMKKAAIPKIGVKTGKTEDNELFFRKKGDIIMT